MPPFFCLKDKVINRAFLLIIYLLSLILLFVSLDLHPQVGDEGILAMDGWRIFKGEMAQKNFFQFIPPLAKYIQPLFLNFFLQQFFQ